VKQTVRVIIPLKLQGAKTRLASVLTLKERQTLAFSMFKDVLNVTSELVGITVLSRSWLEGCRVPPGLEVLESNRGLDETLNNFIEEWVAQGWPQDLLIVMADLALLTKEDVESVLDLEGDVVLSPGRGGGTNIIHIRNSRFRTCYRGLSFAKHIRQTEELGLKIGVYYSYRAVCDIDEPEDLAEVLLHGHGETKSLLESMGFKLSEKGRRCPIRHSNL